ncbi:hypothetical protein JQM63_01005 [Oscillibacter valericigenes]|nr:hypothetical protein [Oscillibacter valericigenes]
MEKNYAPLKIFAKAEKRLVKICRYGLLFAVGILYNSSDTMASQGRGAPFQQQTSGGNNHERKIR